MTCGDFGGRATDGGLCKQPVKKPGRCARHPFFQAEYHPDPTKNAFLNHFSQHACVSHAADGVGIHRSMHYQWLKDDKEYEEAFKLAKLVARDFVHMELNRRGLYGVRKPIYQGGKKVGEITEYSDACIALLHRFHFPEVHKNVHELSGKDGAPIEHKLEGLSMAELIAMREAALKSTVATEQDN